MKICKIGMIHINYLSILIIFAMDEMSIIIKKQCCFQHSKRGSVLVGNKNLTKYTPVRSSAALIAIVVKLEEVLVIMLLAAEMEA
jgi:hypothetical protein